MGECHFYYDAQKRPAKVKFNGTMYTYVHNLQGDIVGILDSAGTLVVEYVEHQMFSRPTGGYVVADLISRETGEVVEVKPISASAPKALLQVAMYQICDF